MMTYNPQYSYRVFRLPNGAELETYLEALDGDGFEIINIEQTTWPLGPQTTIYAKKRWSLIRHEARTEQEKMGQVTDKTHILRG
jgi:hypothetical protein